MPPVSRRKRRYEERAGKRKARNLGATLLLVFAVLAMLAFFYLNQKQPEAKLQVLVQSIKTDSVLGKNNNLRLAIPFQEETCSYLKEDIFGRLKNVNFLEDGGSIQGSSVSVGMSDEAAKTISPSDIPLLYVNGHLKESSTNPEDVVWFDPDQKEKNEISLAHSLKEFSARNGVAKIVLLDAGQFSWTPAHPNRKLNSFQAKLGEIVKSIESKNLWVILSHSMNEVSLTCTPRKKSVFSIAIAETIKELCARSTSVSVEKFFKEIYDRCVSYSVNFSNDSKISLQHPRLYRSGIGLVEELTDGNSNGQLAFRNHKEFSAEKRTYSLDSIFNIDGNLTDWLDGDNLSDLYRTPVQSLHKLEILMDTSIDSDFNSYELKFNKEEYFPNLFDANHQSEVDKTEIDKKRKVVGEFRTNCVRLALELRVVAHLLLWNETSAPAITNVFSDQQYWPLEVRYSNAELGKASDFGAMEVWNSEYKKFSEHLASEWRFNEGQYKKDLPRQEIESGSETLLLTPVQAELLGNTTQRLLQFCKMQLPVNDFSLNLNHTSQSYPPELAVRKSRNSTLKGAHDFYFKKIKFDNLTDYKDSLMDTQKRIFLAVYGSENLNDEPEFPQVGIEQGTPRIELVSQENWKIFEGHNFFHVKLKDSRDDIYEIEVTDLNESASNNGIEIQLLENTKRFAKRKTRIRTANEFTFYVFARPVVERKNNEFRFDFSAQLASDPSSNAIQETITIPFEPIPMLQVKTVRVQGTAENEGSWGSLNPWRIPSLEEFGQSENGSRPIQLNSLVNLRSDFEFRIKSNAPTSLNGIDAELYLLNGSNKSKVKLFESFAADSIPRNNGSDDKFNDEFMRLVWNDLDFFDAKLSPAKTHEKLADCLGLRLDAMSEMPLRLKFLEQNVVENSGQETLSDPSVQDQFLNLDVPLMLVLFSTKGEIRRPLWFQFLEINPRLPFSPTDLDLRKPFQLKSFITGKNRLSFESLAALLPPEDFPLDGEYGSCSYHVFSNKSENSQAISLSLQEAIEDQKFDVEQIEKPAVAMIDIAGIPNLSTIAIDEEFLAYKFGRIRTENRAGIRVQSDFWEADSSGFVFYHDLYKQEPTGVDEFRTIYLRPRNSELPGNGDEIAVEFALPYLKSNTPTDQTSGFVYAWNEGETQLSCPVSRNYFLDRSTGSFFSILKRHQKIQKNVPLNSRDFKLTVRLGDSHLGKWKITSRNPNVSEMLALTSENTELRDLDEEFEIDVSKFKTTVTALQVGISGEELLPINNSVFEKLSDNKFRFRLGAILANYSSFDLESKIRQKEEYGGYVSIPVKAEVTDFFGKKWSTESKIRLRVEKVVKPAVVQPSNEKNDKK